MNINEALEIVHRNGTGRDLRCFLISFGDTEEEKDCISLINNYKYNKGVIKISIDQCSLQKHEKNLSENSGCEILIKKDGKQIITVKLFCKFIHIEDKHIFVEAKNIKYPDDEERETTCRILADEKKMGTS